MAANSVCLVRGVEQYTLLSVFTGIIEATAAILERTDSNLMLERPTMFDDIRIGSSIAVSGACLSMVTFDDRSMTFNVVPETWKKTKFGSLQKGDRVNLEQAMRADGRFEGHVVQGHIEGVGEVVGKDDQGLSIRVPSELVLLMVPKGSITLDGVSLTIASLNDDLCTVALIPLTLAQTTLGSIAIGDHVNIETDLIGKYIQRMLPPSK
jgi:riboflavin synthase